MNSSNAKTIAVLIIIAVLGFFLYKQFSGDDNATTTVTDANGQPISTIDPNVATIGADIQALLVQINGLQIDAEIFSDPVFKSLTDFTSPVAAQPTGKKNPFAPFASQAPVKTAPKAR